MRFQLSQEQIDFYSSLPQEVKQHFVDVSSSFPASHLPPGIRRIMSLNDFDQALHETYEFFAPEIDPQPDAIQTYLPHLGFGIRYWLSHCSGKDGYYNFDFIDRSGERINTPPGIRLVMEYNFHVRSTADIQLTRKLQDPAAFGISPDTTLPPGCEIFVIYCGRPHILELNGREVHRFQPPDVPGRCRVLDL